MDHLGAAIGPLLALAFLWFFPGQLRWLFLLTLVPAIPLVILVACGLHEVPHAPQKVTKEKLGWSLRPFPARFRWYLLSLVVFTLGNSSDSFLLVRAGELGVPTLWLTVLWFVFHVAKSAGNLVCGGLVDRVGPRPLILVGWLLYAVVYLAFGLATAAWQIWVLFLVYAQFYALTEPAEKALVVALVGHERKGLAYGWFNLTIGVAALPASVVFGRVYDLYGGLAAFGMGAGLALVAAAMLALLRSDRSP
jgi:predicted MFS family arabinose efflux permease